MKPELSVRKNKHLILDQGKLKKAQRVLGAKTETETIERALEMVISEDESMSGILFDTSVYIAAFRQGNAAVLQLRRTSRAGDNRSQPLWLSAVVLSELLIGVMDRQSQKALLRMEREFSKIDRLVVPLQSDWRLAGEILAEIGRKYGYEQVGRARMTNDALIAMSAGRRGLTVLTKNADDFRKIAEFRPFKWEVV
jgi:predicted nucleic acid-binding protein